MLSVAERNSAYSHSNSQSSHLSRARATRALYEQDAHCSDPIERARLIDEVILLNLQVADAVAAKYAGRGLATDDLIQVARLGLTRAARRFNVELGHDFLSYAVPCINGEIKKSFRDAGWAVRPPRRLQEASAVVNGARSRLIQRLHREPTVEEIAEATGLESFCVREVRSLSSCFTPVSLDRSVSQEDPDVSLGDQLGGPDPAFERAETRCLLDPLMQRLSVRERRILYLCVMEGVSQREVGEDEGVSQAQISRILNGALKQLRGSLELAVAL